MPDNDPFYFKYLEKLGFNMTRLRWRLYKLEQRRERLREGPRMPERYRWLHFRHKICRECGAVNDRDDRRCYKCDERLPSLLGYRVGRLFGFMLPQDMPHAITAFAVISVVVFCINLMMDGPGGLFSPSANTLLLSGALFVNVEAREFPWWTLMTFGVVHSGILHIAFNGYAMTVLSRLTEGHLGFRRTVVLIAASQLGAAYASLFWYLDVRGDYLFTVGASGWVSGLLGYAIVYTWSLGPAGNAYRSQLVQWAVYILLFGLFMGANNAGHIGGAIAGAMVGFVHNRRARETPLEARGWSIAFWVSAGLWAACFAAQTHFFFTHLGDAGT